jgi:hypothetical protein
MKSEVVGRSSVVGDDLVKSADKKKQSLKNGDSLFQNFHVSLHKFHAPFLTRLSQLGYDTTRFERDGFRKCL